MKRFTRFGLRWVLLLSLVSLGEAPQQARGDEKKPVHLDILVPEDAQLEVNGHKTKSTGESRRFESPPVPVGRTYSYSLKVSWRGHTLSRRIQVQPERPLTLDLRKDIEAMAVPKPVGSFALLAPTALILRADQKVSFPVRVKRFDFPDPIRVQFEKLPKGITAPGVMLSEGQDEITASILAAPDAPQGSYEIRIAAAGGETKDASTIAVTISKPESSIESKSEKKTASLPETKGENLIGPKLEIPSEQKPAAIPETKREKKSAPRLRILSSPGRVALRPGESKYVEIKTATESGEPLPAEPVVNLVCNSENKLTSAVWTIFDFKNNSSAYTVGFAVKAASDAPPGEQKMTVLAVADKTQIEHVLHFQVGPIERKLDRAARPAAVWHLELPSSVEVTAGQTKFIEVKVKTADGSPLPAEPKVNLDVPPQARLRTTPWTFTFKSGQSSCTIGFAVTSEAGGPVGDHEARICAIVGNDKTERTLKITVKPSSERTIKP